MIDWPDEPPTDRCTTVILFSAVRTSEFEFGYVVTEIINGNAL